ncbi:hypothetical protein [Nocardioides lacusdianchii]|uniref:hypothetical protein n=1 Tax=Nocardioides lacusdianchii TaxID=2783664 RepID=UPI001CC940CD|nr:hypothetical protein [Nocardioides lacusdianchii]
MAGGMTPGGRETLAQRTQTTREREAARRYGHGTSDFHGTPPAPWADALTDATPADHPPPVKHCWYDGPRGRQPALLLGWRNTGGHYDGRIAVAAPEPDGWAIVEMWVSQGMLSPA